MSHTRKARRKQTQPHDENINSEQPAQRFSTRILFQQNILVIIDKEGTILKVTCQQLVNKLSTTCQPAVTMKRLSTVPLLCLLLLSFISHIWAFSHDSDMRAAVSPMNYQRVMEGRTRMEKEVSLLLNSGDLYHFKNEI